MDNIFTTELLPEEITVEVAKKYIALFRNKEMNRLKRLAEYYEGKHSILSRQKSGNLSNNRIVTNHAKYISDFASAYLLGEPVAYTTDSGVNIDAILDVLKKADSATQDRDLALDQSIFGRAYELMYMSSDERPVPKLARISPLNAFVVYDDTVEQKPVFGVYFNAYADTNGNTRYRCYVATEYTITEFAADNNFTVIGDSIEIKPNAFGAVPLNEIYNNGQRNGDFEQVIPLIDAYNVLQSDRINDKEQFVDALLLLKGTTLGDDNEEKNETYKAIKEMRVLEIPGEGADAAYLTRQFDESSIEVLRQSIVADIHKISCVPDMTDQNFAANASGVAMKYKLLGLEQLSKTKERYFAEGLRYRLQLIQNILSVQGAASVDLSQIDITFKRSLPANEAEEAQIVSTLEGIVPQENLLALLSFVKDPKAAAEKLQQEKQAAAEEQRKAFMNMPIVQTEDNEE